MAQSIRCTTLLLCLLLSLIPLQQAIALPKVSIMPDQQVQTHDEKLRNSNTEMITSASGIKGRKMKLEKVEEKQMAVMKVKSYSSSFSKCRHGGSKEELNLDCELSLAKTSSKEPYISLDNNEDNSCKRKKIKSSSRTQRMRFKESDIDVKKKSNTTKVTKISYHELSSSSSSSSFQEKDVYEGVAEVLLKMLNKDYHERAHHHPPINNHLPLQSEDHA